MYTQSPFLHVIIICVIMVSFTVGCASGTSGPLAPFFWQDQNGDAYATIFSHN